MKKFFTIAIVALSINAFAQIPVNGLVGYWPFNGNANDESGNGNNGTVQGAILTFDRFGNSNSAYYFDGATNFITVANSTSIKVTNSVSISAWVKNTGDTSINIVVTKGIYGSLWDYGLANCWSYTSYYDYNNAFVIREYMYKNDMFNQWHHLVVTVDENNENKPKLYFDGNEMLGQLVTSDNNIRTDDWIRPTDGDLYIGSNSVTGFFKGDIDDIRIYNRALDKSEISTLFNENICYQSVTVTDTLVITANFTSFNPVTYANTIKVFPNPTKDKITIDCGSNYNSLNGYTIKITNSMSQVVYSSNITQQSATIDLSTWTGRGVYFVHLVDGNGSTVDIKKIVLQ